MGLNLYFLRHGETTYSRSGGYCGLLDPQLTDQGTQMAKAFADTYKSIPWSAIYVSPMKRTIATAKPLCEATGQEMQLRDGLKEMNFGQWESQTPEWVKQNHLDDYINWMTEPAWNPPTGGETAVEVASRALLVISEIEAKYTSGHVLVVSHKTTIRIILCNLLGIDLGRYRDRIAMPAASLSIVQFGVHGPLLLRLGDRSYMSEELQSLPEG
ncbi:Phosphoglycerate mutase [Gloeothece citriformis PCC 7424]|uniref:Phosphoglycerate mutase n=1 Tax=Gloeothece citriformis (strain PCC 7424) TaxID=65393 RepID=B7KBN8_GLOC7|nr:histidine phosphatase family protein [Gloeothece citriformis]ACK73016.1 Phosphoglycerate mutase [Gloeothece citriformis PCC 7424]